MGNYPNSLESNKEIGLQKTGNIIIQLEKNIFAIGHKITGKIHLDNQQLYHGC